MVLGIIAVLAWFAGIGELALVILSITFGAVGLRRANGPWLGTGHGQATAGLVLGIIGAVGYVCFGIATLGLGFIA